MIPLVLFLAFENLA